VAASRNTALDVARGLGIGLVFYGHLVEKLHHHGSPPALAQWKWVYAFHMPLFFFLAGVFWRPRTAPPAAWLRGKLRTRLLPVLSFSLIALPLWWLLVGSPAALGPLLRPYLQGQPMLNWVTWFLVCLLMVECWAEGMARVTPLARSDGAAIGATMALLLGIAAIVLQPAVAEATGLSPNAWFVSEGLVALPFYLVGLLCRPWLVGAVRPLRDVAVLGVAAVALFATFDANGGFRREPVVVMAMANHGAWWWFYATALAGIFFAVSCCRLAPLALRPLAPVGRSSLLYLGLAGLSFSFVELPLIRAVGFVPRSHAGLLLYGGLYVAACLALGFPIVQGLRRYAPRAFGLPVRGDR
jgi:fucose 4-O-acetylase-like acetyltransferase